VIGSTVQIARDPFARHDVIRRKESARHGRTWCGQKRKGCTLFRYGVWSDGGRQHWQDELFCSVRCMRSWHKIE
jgi:hypothetical protein